MALMPWIRIQWQWPDNSDKPIGPCRLLPIPDQPLTIVRWSVRALKDRGIRAMVPAMGFPA
jgi:hypothetical protein